jgi:hypothetical protein
VERKTKQMCWSIARQGQDLPILKPCYLNIW